MLSLPKSLSIRLLLVFVVSAMIFLMVLSALFSYGLSTEWRQQIRPHLAQYVYYVKQDLGSPPSIEKADELANSLPVDIHIYDGQRVVHSTTETGFDPDNYTFSPRGRRDSGEGSDSQDEQRSGLVRQNIEFAQSRHHSIVKIGMNSYSVYVEFDRQPGSKKQSRPLIWLLPAVLIGLLTGLYFLLRKLLAPIGDIKAGVAVMTAGNLAHQIPVKRDDDLGQLAQSVNELSARIQELLDAKRELLLSVSHELRSPITRAHLATEMMPESKAQKHVLDDLRLLNSLIESIMESERLQSKHTVLNKSELNLEQLVRSCADNIESEFKQQVESLTVRCDSNLNTQITGDEVRLRLLFRNLLNNAVQHGRSNDNATESKADITIEIVEIDNGICCHISDQGPGVSEADRTQLTEAFFRPDRSRTHGTGGVGLGLSLALAIANAHDGALTFSARADGLPGLTATVTLPRN
jgi:signal transduction histidine kinase